VPKKEEKEEEGEAVKKAEEEEEGGRGGRSLCAWLSREEALSCCLARRGSLEGWWMERKEMTSRYLERVKTLRTRGGDVIPSSTGRRLPV